MGELWRVLDWYVRCGQNTTRRCHTHRHCFGQVSRQYRDAVETDMRATYSISLAAASMIDDASNDMHLPDRIQLVEPALPCTPISEMTGNSVGVSSMNLGSYHA